MRSELCDEGVQKHLYGCGRNRQKRSKLGVIEGHEEEEEHSLH